MARRSSSGIQMTTKAHGRVSLSNRARRWGSNRPYGLTPNCASSRPAIQAVANRCTVYRQIVDDLNQLEEFAGSARSITQHDCKETDLQQGLPDGSPEKPETRSTSFRAHPSHLDCAPIRLIVEESNWTADSCPFGCESRVLFHRHSKERIL